jgi:hypothetical protein
MGIRNPVTEAMNITVPTQSIFFNPETMGGVS